jgi:nicotinamidase-related amidase
MADAAPAPLQLAVDYTAVVVIECQNDLIHASRIGERSIGNALATAVRDRGVLANINRILAAARTVQVPVLYANKETRPGMPVGDAPIYRMSRRHPILVEGTWGAAVHDDIAPHAGDHLVRRVLSIDASYGSDLYGLLRALGRTTMIAMGVSTNFAVEGTVRGAVNRGFRVVVAEDGCASAPEDMHRFSIERILPLLATVSDSHRIAAALAPSNTSSPSGRGMR